MPDEADWTLAADPFVGEGGDAIAFDSGTIPYQASFDDITSTNANDYQQLFMGDNDLQAEFLLADVISDDDKGEECSALSDLSGKRLRRRRGLERRDAMYSSTVGVVTAFPAQTVMDATSFDLLYCPVASIFIRSLFVSSSPDPLKAVLTLGFLDAV